MNGEYDGSITIKTAIDTSGFVAGEKDLAKSAQEAADKIQNIGVAARNSLNKQVEQFAKANDAYREQAALVADLRNELEELRNTRVLTDEVQALVDEHKSIGKQLDKNREKQRQMVEIYGEEAAEGRRAYQALIYEASRLTAQYQRLELKVRAMRSEGVDLFKPADTSATEEKLEAAESKRVAMLDHLNSKYKDLRANIGKYSEDATKAHKQAAPA